MPIIHRATLTLALLVGFSLAALEAKDAKTGLESTPQAKAYRSLMKAVDAGNFEAYRKGLTIEAAKDLDRWMKELGKTPKETIEFFKTIAPADVKITSVKVDGKKATLSTTGKMEGAPIKGTIPLEEEDGRWKIGKQNWTNAE